MLSISIIGLLKYKTSDRPDNQYKLSLVRLLTSLSERYL